jgi:hypothetical protein
MAGKTVIACARTRAHTMRVIEVRIDSASIRPIFVWRGCPEAIFSTLCEKFF